ncbi:transmembrane and coiled-coil domain-containing protein 4 [Babesia gibsoni]|uniref:Transmembrane and coiled-coil domain-containing protein 4 n=1 Tax=Babesia gibsoni TaxID=33632 RepID=A0AAD8LP87_BABGI|nr:transmembrane and coiled-coil domain-containing protein 4 [Babesia gibsoni]
MERRITQGEVILDQLEEEQCKALIKQLNALIDSFEPKKAVDRYELESCQNVRITYSPQILQQLTERRYKERLEGISVANSVQYIRFKPDCLVELPESLRISIISVLVAQVIDHIHHCRGSEVEYLTKWGVSILKRIGMMLDFKDVMLDALIKPVAQYSTLKSLYSDMGEIVKKDHHLQEIALQLAEMQDELDCEFKQNVEEAKNYLNTPEMIQTAKKYIKRGLLGSISSKINRVLSRPQSASRKGDTAEEAAKSNEKNAEPPSEQEPDGVNETESEEEAYDYVDELGEFNVKDELLLESVPGRAVLLRSLVTSYIMSGSNDSRVQQLFQDFSAALGMTSQTVLALENHIATEIVNAIHASSTSGTTKKVARNMKIAAVAAGSGALIAISAGMATPAIAAGLAVLGIGGGGVSGLWATTEEAELLASVFGVGSSGLVGWRGKKLSSKMDFEFHHVNEQSGRSLAICIGVHGMLSKEIDIALIWEEAVRAPLCDFYALQWESTLMRSLGDMCHQICSQDFASSASLLWQKSTLDVDLQFSIQWPLSLIHYATPLDNAWTVAKQRAKQYGITLAYAIMDRQSVGERPTSLVGYGIGARTILYALLKLKEKNKFNMVKDVVFMGLPSTAGPNEWAQCLSVVAGRLINVYSRNDWVLGYLYRYLEPGSNVAGLRPIVLEGIENYDATDVIKNHNEYLCKMSDILTLVHFDL